MMDGFCFETGTSFSIIWYYSSAGTVIADGERNGGGFSSSSPRGHSWSSAEGKASSAVGEE